LSHWWWWWLGPQKKKKITIELNSESFWEFFSSTFSSFPSGRVVASVVGVYRQQTHFRGTLP
jgi:hypothetical protein